MAWKFPRLTRRSFLKSTGYSVAGAGLLSPISSITGNASSNVEADNEEISYTICNFCSSLCNVRVVSRTNNGNKRVVKLEGNPNSTLNRGKLCARGQSGLRQTYDKDRLKTPLIRIEGSKRGENKFRTATWEETWKYIQDKQKKADIQPWEWTMVGGWTSCIFYMNWAVPFALSNEIPNIIASPMQHCVTTGHIGTDTITGNFNIHDEVLPDYDNAKYILLIGNNASIGAVSTSRMVRFAQGMKNGAKVVVLDPRQSETAAKADEWITIRPGTDLAFLLAMLKIMMDDGLYDAPFLKRHTNMPFLVTKDKDGEWQSVTDEKGNPLVVQEGSDKIRILKKFTNDNRDSVDGGEVFCPGLKVTKNMLVDGKPVITVFQAQLQELSSYTPEWASVLTGIDSIDITRIAHEFGSTRPAIVDPGWHGARFENVQMTRRVQAMIQALTGGIDKEGGWINSGEYHHKAAHMFKAREEGHDAGPPMVSLAGMDFAKMVIGAVSKGENFSHGYPGWAWSFSAQEKAAGRPNVALPVMADTGFSESVKGLLKWKGKPYKTRAVIINAANPIRHYYSDSYWKEALTHDNMELVIAIDVLPSDSTPYADVILPNSTYLERDEPTLYGNGVNHDLALTTRYAAIDILYDTEETPDILLKMTEIITGKTEEFLGAIESLTGLPAEPVKAAYARIKKTQKKGAFLSACREVSFQETAKRLNTTVEELDNTLREKGIYHEEDKEHLLEKYAMPYKLPVPTDSGRLEFFSGLFHGLRKAGYDQPNFSVFATYLPPRCRKGKKPNEPLAKDEFYFTYGKTPTVSYASTNSNNPVLASINRFKQDIYTGVWINPKRAAALSLKSGDKILMTNTLSGQQATGKAYVTNLVSAEALFIHSSFGSENKKLTKSFGLGTATNKLIPYLIEPVVAGFRSQEFTLKVSKVSSTGGAV